MTREQEGTMKVRDIMTQPPCTCRLDTSLGIASRRMKDMGCGTLAVLDQRGRVAGILTDRDLAIAIGQTNRDSSHISAQEAMTGHVYTCSPDDDLPGALQRMTEAKVRRLPVVTSDGDLQGILSIDDIILWGVQHGGVTRKDLVQALRAICAAHAPVFDRDALKM
jgi:CBS domain-containing protein